MLSAMFSFHGRIGRMQYFLRSMALVGAIFGVIFVPILILCAGRIREALHGGPTPGGGVSLLLVFGVLALICLPAGLWSSLSLQARRFRDIGWNPLFVILGWIGFDLIDRLVAGAVPSLALGQTHQGTLFGALVGLVLGGALLFWPGAGDSDETYAPPPLEPRDPVDRFRANPTPTPVRDPAPATGFGRRGL
jgi:uncharacterized membrane protein YhaH (DUF805 family)